MFWGSYGLSRPDNGNQETPRKVPRPSLLSPNFRMSALARDSYRKQIIQNKSNSPGSKLGGGAPSGSEQAFETRLATFGV